MKETFGQVLRKLRLSKGVTQQKLAVKAGVHVSYLSKIENGRLPPPAADTIVNICNTLGTPPDELLMLAGKTPPGLINHFSSSQAALRFARNIQSMHLGEKEWDYLTHELKRLRNRTIAELQAGDHICCIYDTKEEHQTLVTSFLRLGLEQGEKTLYITDAHTPEAILSYLRKDGLEVEPYLTKGQLKMRSADDFYIQGGVFEPDATIALLRSETERALAEGYPALRVTGEMSWVLLRPPGLERLLEYEAKLNSFFPGSRCVAMCQYDRQRFDATLLLDVLITNPIVVLGTDVCTNPGYVPPEQWGSQRSAAMMYHTLERLVRRRTPHDVE